MSRTLNDDFDEDDVPSGGLDLETGSHVGGSGVSSNYQGDGTIDFDDDLSSDEGTGGALELDMPPGPESNRFSGKPSGQGSVPDLALPPPAKSSGSLPAGRTSGSHPAVRTSVPAARTSGATPAAPQSRPDVDIPPAPPSSDRRAAAQQMHGDDADETGPHLSGQPGPPPAPEPPAKPTAASVIAKYPPAPAKVWETPKYAIRILLRQFELRSELESLRRRRSPDVPLYEAALSTYDKKTFRLGMAINCAALTIATFIFFLPVIIRFMRAD